MDVGVMIKNRKTIILAIVAVLIIAVATTAAIVIINSNMNKNSSVKTKVPISNKSGTTLMTEAEAARKTGDTTERKLLLSEASAKLKQEPKSDANTNAQVDVAAQQCLAGVKSACKGY
jgi:hypothetical protein